jgi:hypothetical protein
VNKSYPEEFVDESISRKISADIFIDDRNIGGFPGWGEIWQILFPYEPEQKEAEKKSGTAQKRILNRLFTKKTNKNENG